MISLLAGRDGLDMIAVPHRLSIKSSAKASWHESAEFPQMIIIYCVEEVTYTIQFVKVVQKKNEGHNLWWWWWWWRMRMMDSIFGKEAIHSTADPREP